MGQLADMDLQLYSFMPSVLPLRTHLPFSKGWPAQSAVELRFVILMMESRKLWYK